MQKKITLSVIIYFFMMMPYSLIAQPEYGNCIQTSLKKGKTIIKKHGKKLAELPFEAYYRRELTSSAIFCTYRTNDTENSEDGYFGLLLNCDGKIVMDSIKRIGYAIENYDSIGGSYSNNKAIIVLKKKKFYLYDFNLKPYPNNSFDYISSSIDRHENKRPDLFPNTTILQCLDVYNIIDGKKQYGIYELHKGNLIMQPRYQENNNKNNNIMQYGFINVKSIDKEEEMLFGFFDKNTNISLPPKTYPDIVVSQLSKNADVHPAIAIKIDDKYYTENGKLISLPANDKVEICNNYFKLYKNGKVGLYELEGKQLMPTQYDSIASEFCYWDMGTEKIQFIPIKQGKVWKYYDVIGEGIIPNFECEYAYPVIKNIGRVKKDGKSALITPNYSGEQREKVFKEMEADFDTIKNFATIKIKDLSDKQKYIFNELKNVKYSKQDYLKELEGYKFWINSYYAKYNQQYVSFLKKWGQTAVSFYTESFDDMQSSFTETLSTTEDLILRVKKDIH